MLQAANSNMLEVAQVEEREREREREREAMEDRDALHGVDQ